VSKVTGLLEALLQDPYEVALTRNEYSEHEAASALKRFFVNLPEPVLSEELMKNLAECRSAPAMGRLLKESLETVTFATVKKLFGHLHLIAHESARNKMDAANLATIWAVGLTQQTGVVI
jgi:Arf-GAP with Rho-GAP domain, ANK repeat and PH domain-containing protein 1